MTRAALFAWVAALALTLPTAAQTTKPTNLVPNGGLEGAKGKLPPDWEHLIIGAPSELVIDREVKHGGSQSVRLTAKEVTRSYAHSEASKSPPASG